MSAHVCHGLRMTRFVQVNEWPQTSENILAEAPFPNKYDDRG